MEPAITLELLGDQRRATHLPLVIAHQAAIGLFRESDLGTCR